MRPNPIRQRWQANEPVRCAWLSTGDPIAAELFGHGGLDAILIDMQHGPGVGPERAVELIRAVNGTPATPFVRVPWNDPVWMQTVLDAGAMGVVVPLINTPEEAVKAAGACRYPPLGYRSVGPNRATYGQNADYFQHANDEVAVLLMIEHIDAVEAIEEIAQTPGIDGFFIGPGDLAISLGLPPAADVQDPRHIAACARVRDVAQANGLVVGIAVGGPEEARRRFVEGYNFCPMTSDWGLLQGGLAAALATFGLD